MRWPLDDVRVIDLSVYLEVQKLRMGCGVVVVVAVLFEAALAVLPPLAVTGPWDPVTPFNLCTLELGRHTSTVRSLPMHPLPSRPSPSKSILSNPHP